ncbi:MAG: sugar phosphate nucleotidyltransferase [Bacteroidota bacterium]
MKAVILAGGLGTRLKPFTDVIPKPLLPLGEKSVLEIQLEQLRKHGFQEVFLAVNYKAEYIQSYLGDGEKFGIKLRYSVEEKPLGTCGPITLLKDQLTEPFLLMNGDILTKANFSELFGFALKYTESALTIITKVITTPFRFGNISSDGVYVTGVEEKPDLKFEILAGMYIMKPEIFNLMPHNQYYGIDTLIKNLLQIKHPITKIITKDYWLDIGVVEDYEKAREIYDTHFKEQ